MVSVLANRMYYCHKRPEFLPSFLLLDILSCCYYLPPLSEMNAIVSRVFIIAYRGNNVSAYVQENLSWKSPKWLGIPHNCYGIIIILFPGLEEDPDKSLDTCYLNELRLCLRERTVGFEGVSRRRCLWVAVFFILIIFCFEYVCLQCYLRSH